MELEAKIINFNEISMRLNNMRDAMCEVILQDLLKRGVPQNDIEIIYMCSNLYITIAGSTESILLRTCNRNNSWFIQASVVSDIKIPPIEEITRG